MRIAMLNTLYAPYRFGGAERAVQILAEGLVRRGHAVSVITLGEHRAVVARSVVNGVTVRRIPLENGYWPYDGRQADPAVRALWHVRDCHNASMAARVGRALDAEAPDVVHTNNLAGFSVAAWREAGRRGLPIVHTLHDYYLMCPPSTMYRREQNCARSCSRCRPFAAWRRHASRAVRVVAGVSRFILERHVGEGFFPNRARSEVVFNSVEPVKDAPVPRVAPFTFGFIGRVCEGKGVRWLLQSFTACRRPGERLVIAGDGEPAYVRDLQACFGSAAVRFLGQVDPAAFYPQVDALVVPSLWNEPFGRIVIEALAHRLPVIASRRGGMPEIVQHGGNGLLVDPDDRMSLGEAMRRLADRPRWARQLGAAGARDLARYSEASALAAYEAAYASAVRR